MAQPYHAPLTGAVRTSFLLGGLFRQIEAPGRGGPEPMLQAAPWRGLLTLLAWGLLLAVMSVAPSDGIALGALVATGLTGLACGPRRLPSPVRRLRLLPLAWMDWLVLGYLALCLVATSWSSYKAESIVGLLKAGLMTLPYWMARLTCYHGGVVWMRRLMGLVLAVSGVQAVVALWQSMVGVQAHATWVDPKTLPEYQLTRVFGTLQPLNPNLFAGFQLGAFPGPLLVFGLAPWLAKLWGQALHMTRLLWLVSLGASLLVLVSIVLSGCRGAYLGVFVTFVGLYGLVGHWVFWDPVCRQLGGGRWRCWWLVGGLAGLGLAFVAVSRVPAVWNRLVSIGAGQDDSSIAYRFHVYQSVKAMAVDNWLVGIGPGNDVFKKVYGFYMHSGFHALSAYSIPLELLLELGLAGLVWFLAMVGTLKMRLLQVVDQASIPNTQEMLLLRLIAVGGFLGAAAMLCHGLFDTVWFRPSVQGMFWIQLALFVTASEALRRFTPRHAH
jgi:putative inorganic carbon (hco3(-)) transporter